MKKKHDTIESLLETGKKTGLTFSEREEMWAELKSYTEFHTAQTVQEPKAPLSWLNSPFSKFVASLAVVVLIISTGAASNDSLPGEFLYDVKVDIVEPIIGFSQLSETERLDYELELLDRRLFEMQEISRLGLLNEESVQDLEEEAEDRGVTIARLISDEGNEIQSEVKLKVISSAQTVIRTQEYIEDTKYDKKRRSKFETAENNLDQLYQTEANEFVELEPEIAMKYLGTILADINEITEISTSTETISTEVSDYLVDIQQALENGQLKEALEYTNEAQQVMELNENIEKILIEVNVEPEGNVIEN